ncbi:transposase [Streptomyces sp. NPDC102360]|uniref:transposase n=1 Tax=Streptomyces sp. NPDC102360 TaxID=3366160 RepID=UPI0038004DC6
MSAWEAQHPSVSVHSGRYEMREIVTALLYQARNGCQWDYLPHDLPPTGAVKYYFCLWFDSVRGSSPWSRARISRTRPTTCTC